MADAPALPRKRPGPKPNPSARRGVTKCIRYSEAELELLEYRAAKAGVPVAVFVRLSSLGRND
jgi:hypothetical protein